MRLLFSTAVVATALSANLCYANIPSVDGVLGAEWTGVAHTSVIYDPLAPSGNFQAPTNANNVVAYDIYLRSDSDNVYGLWQAEPPAGDGYTSGFNFLNLYLDTDPPAKNGSDIGFEVTNDRAFNAGFSGYYGPLASVGFQYAVSSPAPGVGSTIEWAMPWSFFTTDPLGMGFVKTSTVNSHLTVRLSQAFGYSVAGGNGYGPDRLGSVNYEAAAVPEASATVLLVAMCCATAVFKRKALFQ